MDESKPKRTLIIKPQATVVVPTIDALMNDALAIIGNELAFYRLKTQRGSTLMLKEAKAVRDYVNALISLTKENREIARLNDLSDLSDQELIDLASELVKIKSSKVNKGD